MFKQSPVSLLQLSVVHALLSSQFLVTNWHFPVDLSQLSVVHALKSLHTTDEKTHFPVKESQDPVLQRSVPAQSFGVKTHPLTASQVSMVQALLSLQQIAVLINNPLELSQA
jgi:hypothetical protein